MSLRFLMVPLLASALAACGQSGPLYLPQDVPAEPNQEESVSQEQSSQGQASSDHAQQSFAWREPAWKASMRGEMYLEEKPPISENPLSKSKE